MPVIGSALSVLWAALAYVGAGVLGIWMTWPTGTAVALWPAAGVAVALVGCGGPRLLPGIWLGSFVTNLLLAVHLDGVLPSGTDTLLAAWIGVGAALQALVGALLGRRLLAASAPLSRPREVLHYLLRAGPLACTVNPLWSMLGLLLLGQRTLDAAPQVIFTWWAGDTVGVLLAAPVTLALVGGAVWRPRRTQLLLPLLVCLLLSGLVYGQARQWETEQAAQRLRQYAANADYALERALAGHLEVLRALRDMVQVDKSPERDRFRQLASGLRARHPGVQSLQWIPRITHAERPGLEAAMREAGYADFRLKHFDDARGLFPAQAQAEYFPVLFMEPETGNERALGLDITYREVTRVALERALASDEPALTQVFTLVQETGSQQAVIAYLAVHDGSRARGVLAAVFRLQDLLSTVLDTGFNPDVQFAIRDAADPEVVLFGQSWNASPAAWRETVPFADRTWELVVSPSTDPDSRLSATVGGVMVSTVLFGGVLSAFLLVVSGRTAQVEALVAERTANLEREIIERRAAEAKLRQAATVVENTRDGIIVTDAERCVLSVNPAFSQITGYPGDAVVGRDVVFLRTRRHDAGFYAGIGHALETCGQWQGEIWGQRADGEPFPAWASMSAVRDAQGETKSVVIVFSDISSIKQSQAELEYIAHHDPLTGLPNRLLFLARLEHAIERAQRGEQRLAVLFLDLDNFKNVNDSLGHAVGDNLLRAVAHRLTEQLRRSDTVARQGGDEFTIIMENIVGMEDAAIMAGKLRASLAKPVLVDGFELFVQASIGISVFPTDGTEPATLLRNADAAMYRAKAGGRNTHQFYAESMTRRVARRLSLEVELRRALERDEFRLAYQPQVRLADGGLAGFEALIRWQHPRRGLLRPAAFLTVAEEGGLIVAIGQWVMDAVCAQIADWTRAGLAPPTVAMNVSAPQLVRQNLVKELEACLQRYALRPQAIDIELTETMLMADPARAAHVLRGLKELGTSVVIDDFGTGYSSLAYLKRLPIDTLKMDRMFVGDLPDDVDDVAIARAILDLAHHLRLTVVAEGVETAAQAEFLLAHGCTLAQGYFFGEPAPADVASERMTQAAVRRAKAGS